jgi:ATP-dependent RNA helicase DeaD
MVRYRVEVGSEHGAETKHIVGAIANEAGLESRYIGQVSIHDNYSTVDLPEGMPKAIFKHLRKVWVCGRQLQLSVLGDGGASISSTSDARARPRGKSGDRKPERRGEKDRGARQTKARRPVKPARSK